MQDFVHLHVHTEYSLLDGASGISDLVQKASDLGMKALAITDHGVMYGVIDFYEACKSKGIKPIIGCEVYVAPGSRFDRTMTGNVPYHHLILLAKDNRGYKNLIKLCSKGFTDGYYYKPRVDKELIKEHHEGLIALSACLAGEIPSLVLGGDVEGARSLALEYQEIFGKDNFYLELQSNGIEEQLIVNKALINISRETGIPLVATNDAHYINREDAKIQDILMCIQTGHKYADEDRMRFATDDFYIKSQDEMWERFSSVPEAMENTLRIADMCNVEIEFGRPILPDFGIPKGETADSYLTKLTYEGAHERYGDILPEEVDARLKYELSIICQMGYSEYYLIVWDFIKYAKDHGIMVGPGRGSGAGSLCAYCLKITNIDSLKYNLAFERFLNPERISMPDFDVDFSDERRKEVIDYVISKYGEDRVAQIVSFGTMAARAVIRDVGRVMDVPYQKVDEVSKMIPKELDITIDKALKTVPELRDKYDNDREARDLIDVAKGLEGKPRNCSTHAAGVVLTRDPVTDYVPVHKNGDSIATQFPMKTLEKIGLLKVDFLGLRTLTVIQYALKDIEKNYGVRVDFDNMEMNDLDVYKMISQGRTRGVFQLESPGMIAFMKELKPMALEDIIAGIAMFRPGPMSEINTFIRNKMNPDKVEYLHPMLKPILDVTYGCMVYQEQVMQIVRDLAGYTMGQSDLVRRAMAKKKHDVMAKERVNFIAGCAKNNISEEIANKIFDKMTDFASYAFNKAHAACYAVVAYETAWLKYHYPKEFMCAMMNSVIGRPEKIAFYIDECKSQGIEILPPDINLSEERFAVKNGKIVYGLGALKGVGIKATEALVQIRAEGGNFRDFTDYAERIAHSDVNRKCTEAFIKSGAFTSLKYTRRTLWEAYEEILNSTEVYMRNRSANQTSLMDLLGEEEQSKMAEDIRRFPEFDKRDLLQMEREVTGVYLSGHPLEAYDQYIEKFSNVTSLLFAEDEESGQSTSLQDGQRVSIVGVLTSVSRHTSKAGAQYANAVIEDLYGAIHVIIFPKPFMKYSRAIDTDAIVIIKGRVLLKDDDPPSIAADEIYSADGYSLDNKSESISREIGENNVSSNFDMNAKLLSNAKNIDRIKAFAKYYEGNDTFTVYDKTSPNTPIFEGTAHISKEMLIQFHHLFDN